MVSATLHYEQDGKMIEWNVDRTLKNYLKVFGGYEHTYTHKKKTENASFFLQLMTNKHKYITVQKQQK